MTAENTYSIPAESVTCEQAIKRSRFIAVLGRVKGREEAERFIAETKPAGRAPITIVGPSWPEIRHKPSISA